MIVYTPSLADFTQWVYTAAGVPTAALPSDSPWIELAYDASIALVNIQLAAIPGPIYYLAVYNLAMDNLVNWCPDVLVNGVLFANPDPANKTGLGYFAYLRNQFGILGFTVGPVTSSADESTSSSMEVADFYKSLTIDQLQNLKTPWGRAYLGFASKVGSLWGLS